MANDFNGNLYVNTEGNIPTYSGVVAAYSPYTTATDMAVLQNPASSTVMLKVARVLVSGNATSVALLPIYLYKRSALNTGGTSASITDTAHDSNDAASTGNMLSYSAAPTLNGTGTIIRALDIILAGGTPTGSTPPVYEWKFGEVGGEKQLHLRPGEQLSINNNSRAVPGGASLYFTIEWTETANYT